MSEQSSKPIGGKCPLCNAPSQHEFRPFCSKRCADKDLGNWVTGRYAIPTNEPANVPVNDDDEQE